MRRLILAQAAAAAVLVTGCVPTLHPLYTEQDLIFEAALVGVWHDVDSEGETWDFARAGDNSYRLVYTDGEGQRGSFQAHLLRLAGKMFLDLYPEEPDLAASDFYKLHLIPAHSFMLVDIVGAELRMRVMEPSWLEDYLEQHPDAIAHEEVNEGIVITASTRDLQGFVMEHVGTAGAFSDASTMRRKG